MKRSPVITVSGVTGDGKASYRREVTIATSSVERAIELAIHLWSTPGLVGPTIVTKVDRLPADREIFVDPELFQVDES